MRILIVTAGSRGDVAPFTGLGRRLLEAGHSVALAAHDRFADLVLSAGLEHRTLPGDPVELVRARTAAPSPSEAQAVFAEFLHKLGDGIVAAVAAGTDLVLTAFGPAPLSRAVANSAGLPSAGVYLAPGVPANDSGWPVTRDVVDRSAALYAPVLRRLSLAEPRAAGWPVFHGFSPAVVPRPPDWPDNVHITGYWWPYRSEAWQPPDQLADFLQSGPPPVFIGFGSMTPSQEQLQDIVSAAVTRAGVRAVVQAGWAELGPAGDDILVVGDLPHEWLFPRTAAVVHHAGAGTAAAGLRAGVPAVPVPVLVDQPFWAGRLVDLGVAPRSLPMTELTADALAQALRACLDQPSYRDRATELARRIGAEDGAELVLAAAARLEAAPTPASAQPRRSAPPPPT
ncbi:glycosyltransferase [Actinoplanes sp. Pm04-4]|uniref:Glycosyltransferase n=1 Tax=Paractinoplanes pyxinae TaxID=2997416 RepID=A0ABT4ARZ9_9ACTN|nr:glycosyltransferase [Actinoplanes pyxinae]MCY1137015.1 glycosyltransferase [Actinoplanes pyxinae]